MSGNAEREFAVEVVRCLNDAGFEALWAGGCVRDSLLGREPGDYDVATDARPDDVRRLFRRTLNVGASFGVMIVLGNKQQGQVEVATFRADGEYLDGRRPSDVRFCSAEEDARRRDFTINGMFYDPVNEEIHDYVGGREDLQARVIRAIGDAGERFDEDKLRLLRAVRFAATLGFELEDVTRAAVTEMATQITVVSAERIAQELRKMLAVPNRALAVDLLDKTRLLAQVLPELLTAGEDRERILRTLRSLPADASFEVSCAAVLQQLEPSSVIEISKRLRLSNRESDEIVWYVEHQHALRSAGTQSDADLKRLLSQPFAVGLIGLVAARNDDGDADDAAFCTDYLARTPIDVLNPPPLLTGDDLITAGFAPGPKFKSLLDQVRDAQLNGEITSTEEALALAARLSE